MIALLLLGCAFGPGHAFGEITAADLAIEHVPGEARDLGGGEVLVNNGDRYSLTTFTLWTGSLDLLELEGGGGTFDPANPPEGYGLCHGGHCHADDGSLVAYADIEAELAGDAAEFVPVVAWALPESVAVGDFATALEARMSLPATTLSKARLGATRLDLAGTYLAGEEPLAFSGSLDLSGIELAGPLDLPFGPDEDPSATLDIVVAFDGTLFDDLDPSPYLGTGSLPFDETVTALLLTHVDGVEPVVAAQRSPWSSP